MNITKESTGELTAQIIVEVSEQDYSERVNRVLKDYQRKANMPGFRPGKVPFGIVRKMYGNAVMADEVNKQVSEELTSFIKDNEIKMLGYPVPNDEKTGHIDWGVQKDFSLYFDIGLAPQFEIQPFENITVPYHSIKVSDEKIDEEINRLSEQHGTVEKVETAEEKDWISGDIIKIDENGNPVAGADAVESYIYPASLKDIESKSLFIGLGEHEMVEFDLRSVFSDNKDIARLLKITEKEAENMEGNFRFTVKEVSRLTPAEVNEELFEKAFPGQEVKDEKLFRERVAESIARNYTPESDKLFMQEAVDKIMEQHEFNLPEDFLKRWMLESNRGEVTKEEIEKDFSSVAKSLKWDLVKQKIAKKYDIKVTRKEMEDFVKMYFYSRFGQMPDENDERMKEIVDRVLNKGEDAERIEADIFNNHLLQVLKKELTLENNEVSLDEFIAIAGSKHEHDHDHDHDHHHDHKHDDDHYDHSHEDSGHENK